MIGLSDAGKIVRDFPQEALTLLEPLAERFDETFEALAPLDLCRGLRVAGKRRRDCQPEADEQRERLGCDAEIAFDPLGLARESSSR